MRDFSQTDLIDMCNRRRKGERVAGDENVDDKFDEKSCPAIVNWLGAQKPLHLIMLACGIIALMRIAAEFLL